jgi:hypothetical protein
VTSLFCATEALAVADKFHFLWELGVEDGCMSAGGRSAHKIWSENKLAKMVRGSLPFQRAWAYARSVGLCHGVHDVNQGMQPPECLITDPDGITQAWEMVTPPVERELARTESQINVLRHINATNGAGTTPASLMPGELIPKPRLALEGNVERLHSPEAE